MHRPPKDEVHNALALGSGNPEIDRSQAKRFVRRMAEDFHRQLLLGAPTEIAGLRSVGAIASASILPTN